MWAMVHNQFYKYVYIFIYFLIIIHNHIVYFSWRLFPVWIKSYVYRISHSLQTICLQVKEVPHQVCLTLDTHKAIIDIDIILSDDNGITLCALYCQALFKVSKLIIKLYSILLSFATRADERPLNASSKFTKVTKWLN